MNAASPPRFCACAMTVSVSVVFARGFRPVDFDDPAAREAADAQRAVDEDVAGRDDVDIDDVIVAEPHDRALAVVLRDLLDGEIEVLVAGGDDFALFLLGWFFGFRGHE